ncbi:UTRA domain-containing protein [Amycolatopsis sp. NPDC023774]|uniref:UTRA domain-containing protein n=1 Tax=Amycolatopsis sp. NPDC023774 TaxID=3155015 RepID=UPI0033D18617
MIGQVDILRSQPTHFPAPKTAPGRQEHGRPVSRSDRLDDLRDLLGRGDPPFLRLVRARTGDLTRVDRDRPVTLRRVHYANDEPMMLTHSYEPMEITKGTVIERPEEGVMMTAGLVDRFTAIDMRPTRVVERLRSRMPRPSETEALQLRKGTPVVIIVRTTYSNETPVETADILLDAHRFELEYVLRVDPLQ